MKMPQSGVTHGTPFRTDNPPEDVCDIVTYIRLHYKSVGELNLGTRELEHYPKTTLHIERVRSFMSIERCWLHPKSCKLIFSDS